MRTLEYPVLNEELMGPLVCWLEIEWNLRVHMTSLRWCLSFNQGPTSSIDPSLWHSLLADRSWGWHSAETNSKLKLPVFGFSVSVIWKALLLLTLSKTKLPTTVQTWPHWSFYATWYLFLADLTRFLSPAVLRDEVTTQAYFSLKGTPQVPLPVKAHC